MKKVNLVVNSCFPSQPAQHHMMLPVNTEALDVSLSTKSDGTPASITPATPARKPASSYCANCKKNETQG